MGISNEMSDALFFGMCWIIGLAMLSFFALFWQQILLTVAIIGLILITVFMVVAIPTAVGFGLLIALVYLHDWIEKGDE